MALPLLAVRKPAAPTVHRLPEDEMPKPAIPTALLSLLSCVVKSSCGRDGDGGGGDGDGGGGLGDGGGGLGDGGGGLGDGGGGQGEGGSEGEGGGEGGGQN